jgi:hypothetical protein
MYSWGRFYRASCNAGIRLQLAMASNLRRLAEESPWAVELSAAALGLLLGVAVLPVLIFYAGVASLGRFEGASLGNLYSSLFAGLKEASIASWIVLLGPYGLYLLFRALRAWWRASGNFK